MAQPLGFRFVAALLGGALLVGCGGDVVDPAQPDPDPTRLYWQLALNQRAINLSTAAPHDTFRLVATPQAVDGTPLDGATTVRFTSRDVEAVQVSPDGLLQALQEATWVKIEVTLTRGSVTHQDSAFVTVTPQSVAVTRFALEPWVLDWAFTGESRRSDSAKAAYDPDVGAFWYYEMPLLRSRAFDTNETEVADLAAWIESSDEETATYDNSTGTVNLWRPGPVVFYASTMAYGVPRVDTLRYTVGLPLFGAFAIPNGTLNPSRFVGAAGAYVWWYRVKGQPAYDVTFHDPTHVAVDEVWGSGFGCGATAGNIAPWEPGGGDLDICGRYFPVQGTYPFHSTALNASGTIIIVDEESQPLAANATATRSPSTWQPAARSSGTGYRSMTRSRRPSGPALAWP